MTWQWRQAFWLDSERKNNVYNDKCLLYVPPNNIRIGRSCSAFRMCTVRSKYVHKFHYMWKSLCLKQEHYVNHDRRYFLGLLPTGSQCFVDVCSIRTPGRLWKCFSSVSDSDVSYFSLNSQHSWIPALRSCERWRWLVPALPTVTPVCWKHLIIRL